MITYLLATHGRFEPGLVVMEKPILKPTDRIDFLRKRYGLDFLIKTFFDRRRPG